MIRVRQVKVLIEKDNPLEALAKKIKIPVNQIIDYKIIRKSIDARDKNEIFYVYELDVSVYHEKDVLKRNSSLDVFLSPKEEYSFPRLNSQKLESNPVIVGSGPAGLICAYLLAENGYHSRILERGEKMEERIKTVEEFFQTNVLNPNSNIQFGEGGAGTFSDGKLNTLVKDKLFRGKKVFDIFVENGAPEEILYQSRPHIGTDILRKVIVNIRNKIIAMGGEFFYSSQVTNLFIENQRLVGIEVNYKEIIPCNVLVLAIGHSARDTFQMLLDCGISMKAKNFAVGIRMEHLQEMINKSQYGNKASLLPPASYKLTYQTKEGRGVYSFCMCPGGFVVNASSEEGRLAINGMSNYQRDEKNANSAIVVTVSKKDFGEDPLAGIEFQRKLEEKAFQLGKGLIPCQLYGDFLKGKVSSSFKSVVSNTKGQVSFADLNMLFPDYILNSLKEAIPYFGTKIKGFDQDDSVLLGVESRTSSPVIIVRDEKGEANIKGVYPCGEGAGYAGGITTAAMDGIKVAELIAKSN